MFAKLINLIPRDWLVYMYKYMPFTKLKNWIVYRAQHKFLVAVLGVITNEAGQVLLFKHTYREEPWEYLAVGWSLRVRKMVSGERLWKKRVSKLRLIHWQKQSMVLVQIGWS